MYCKKTVNTPATKVNGIDCEFKTMNIPPRDEHDNKLL